MEKILKTLFGTADRTVVSVIVGVVFVGMTVSGPISSLNIALNENQAGGSGATLVGQCYGGRTPRVFLTWPVINGVVQKQDNRGAWVNLVNSNTKTFYADWDVMLGTPYAYRIKKSARVLSNTVKIRPTAVGCTVTPIASAASTTVPGHVAPFYNDETVRFSVIGEPNRPVQLCYKFASSTVCEPTTRSFSQKMAIDGTWSKDMPFQIGDFTAWFVVANQKSNVIQFSVIAPPGIPSRVLASSGFLGCNGTYTPVTLVWDEVPGAVSYTIGRAITSGGPYATIATGVTASTYTDSNPQNPTEYYVVTATDQYGRASQRSIEVQSTTLTCASEVSVVSPNGGEVWAIGSTNTISWSFIYPFGNVLSIQLLKGSEIVRQWNGPFSTTSIDWPLEVASTSGALTPGTDYSIRVNASRGGTTSVTDIASDDSDAPFTITE